MLILPIQTSFYGFCLCQISFTTNLYLLHKPTAESNAPCLKTSQLLLLIPLPSHATFPKSESLPRFPGSWATSGRKRKAWGNKGGALDPITTYGDVRCRLAGRTSLTKASDYGKVVMPWSIWEAWEEGIRYENMTCFTVWLGWNNILLTFSHPFLIAMFDLLKVVHL